MNKFVVIVLIFISLSDGLTRKSSNHCDSSPFPSQCSCQVSSHLTLAINNETRLRCHSLMELTANDHWSIVPYDRLIFESPQNKLTIHRLSFVNLIARTMRLNSQEIFFDSYAFPNAYIGQLIVSHSTSDARVHFNAQGDVFSGTTITKLHWKSIDFVTRLSESIFSNLRLYTLLIESSKFYGFLSSSTELVSTTTSNASSNEHWTFLDYESSSRFPLNPDEISSDETITMNITFERVSIVIHIVTIVSSINTTNLTEHYFLRHLQYNQTEEIQLTKNRIEYLNSRVFRHLTNFRGRLIFTENQLKSIDPQALTDLVSLTYLSFAQNQLEIISEEHFRHLTHLIELNLSSNRLRSLTNFTFQSLIDLQVLHLDDNPLEVIESETFFNLTRLKRISLQHVHQIDHPWIWSLARLHARFSSTNHFDLTDITFCILSQWNQTEFYSSPSSRCSCPTSYFFHRSLTHLRLTPQCSPSNNFLLRDSEEQCDYSLIYLQCPSTSTTTTTTTMTVVSSEMTLGHSFDSITTFTPTRKAQSESSNNIHKLFTVLSILSSITLLAILLLLFWYRLKSLLKRKEKKRLFLDQQRYFYSLSSHPYRSASLTMLAKLDSDMSTSSSRKYVTQGLIAPLASFSLNQLVRTCDPLKEVKTFIDDETTNARDSIDESQTEIHQIIPLDRY